MSEEKVDEQVAVSATASIVESQLEVGNVSATSDDSAVQKRDRESGAETEDNNTVKKLKTDEGAKASKESVNGEQDATATEEEVAEPDTSSKAESDQAPTATETADEEKGDKLEEDAPADSKSSEPAAVVSSTTTFKGGFGSFTNSGFGAATGSPATTSIFSSASNLTTSTGTNGTATTSAFSSAASAFKGGFSGFSSSSGFGSEKKDNPWAESKVLPKVSIFLPRQ
ncbi:hypothetical protein D0Z00_004593 [Geotrichum galactomycetum]|uniref:Uncharacterized protein n=1 Tax=Geotrichum galactomycetum TaxID=27317 RepID=A0ACB6UY07_9ASCO|nr:hypothetical protein D0Z00_004593 [Geotrichum candidum]